MKLHNWGYLIITVIAIVAFIFIGFELGKHYSARTAVTDAVASIDPFTYCELHQGRVRLLNLSRDDLTYSDMQDYAVDLYIKMAMFERDQGK
jgi:hypothetical protein